MVTIDLEKCTRCGVCTSRFKGFCMSGEKGYPEIDYLVCNQCQKCISICPRQAILMNGVAPERITSPLKIDPVDLKELLARRRSIKKFKNAKIDRDKLLELVRIARYAPSQNKNIDLVIIDDDEIIQAIDNAAYKFQKRLYSLLFSRKIITRFVKLFASPSFIDALKKKMEYGAVSGRKTTKENTAALIIAFGNPRVPVTESSAQYLFATMIIYAEALGIGTTLMDSLKITINRDKSVKKLLGIGKRLKVFGVLDVGYSDEGIVNKPQGYEVEISWNKAGQG